jgi:thiamine-phosphate pyrophosphorylase
MTRACRLYLITPPVIGDVDVFADALKSALDAGDVACLQLRLKSPQGGAPPDADVLRAAERLLPTAQARNVHFLINDRPDLAQRAGADGVHIGPADASYAEARALVGELRTVGVSCRDSMDRAMAAGEAGADYVAFGAFFPTRTKQTAARAPLALIEDWVYSTTVPCVAIGGLNADNCTPVVAAGADFIAVSSAVWDAPEGPAEGVVKLNEAIARALERRHD